jgi:hypothetical protein
MAKVLKLLLELYVMLAAVVFEDWMNALGVRSVRGERAAGQAHWFYFIR